MNLYSQSIHLPDPSPDAIAHAKVLQRIILEAIENNQGKISFEKFMELALYAPGLGYYSAGSEKIGTEGDFVTAPEISSLFSYSIANYCEELFFKIGSNYILEFGAGSGKMAIDILTYLQHQKKITANYFILETSAHLQQKQRQNFEKNAPQFLPFVQWLNTLPSDFNGVMLANEVLDALPVRRFLIQPSMVKEYYVGWKKNSFIWLTDDCESPYLLDEITQIKKEVLGNIDHYVSEVNLRARGWINSVSKTLKKGAILLIDYGFPREVYYHPERSEGTLMCHYRHRSHSNPLILVGLQDITAHVDFSFMAQCATQAHLTIHEYTTQAHFLLNCGILGLAEQETDQLKKLSISREIQKLTMPHEMGELFKVLVLSKNLETY